MSIPAGQNQTSPTNDENFQTSFIGEEINLFMKHVNSIGYVLSNLVIAMQELEDDAEKELNNFQDTYCTEDENDGTKIKIPALQYRIWKKLHGKYEHLALSRILLPRSLLVSLISQYDAYLGRLLRIIFLSKPEILNGSEKKLSFDTLNSFTTIEEAREYMLGKEIEGILRSSHCEQFAWMEKTFKLPLTKGLKSWPLFIELTERRNLFVHADGVVSSQYLASCKKHGYPIEMDLIEGKPLSVPQEYFKESHSTIFEIGVKLGHVLWRKLFPDDRKNADQHMGELTLELIDNGRYQLAIKILDFVCEEFKDFHDESVKLVFIINRAQAYKWNGDNERCKSILKKQDWSAKSDRFRIANAVLGENWKSASTIMRQIGKKGSITKHDYMNWPLFKGFREEEEFKKTYREVFGEEFSNLTEVQNIIPSNEE